MTSDQFVWAWLPGQAAPVVCGRVWAEGSAHLFRYGRSYRERTDAISLFGMPLTYEPISPPTGMRLHGSLRDALPDAWGQHVILSRLTGVSGVDGDTGDLPDLTYMRESASDRFGAIDFQDSPTDYVPRQAPATLDDLADAALALEEGRPLPPSLEAALAHGTSIGGARPKATMTEDDGVGWVAKFSSSSDIGPRVRHEALALELARRCGVSTVESRLTTAAGRDALLVRRFDRGLAGVRHLAVSALTMLDLDELAGRYATYPDLLDVLRRHSSEPAGVGAELFRRIAVNIALGNTDDHARNHAALWDGHHLTLTPAYDIDPCRTPGWDANQAMAYGRDGERSSSLERLVRAAASYDLPKAEASAIVDEIVETITDDWRDALDVARLTHQQGKQLMGTRILHPAIRDGRLRAAPFQSGHGAH